MELIVKIILYNASSMRSTYLFISLGPYTADIWVQSGRICGGRGPERVFTQFQGKAPRQKRVMQILQKTIATNWGRKDGMKMFLQADSLGEQKERKGKKRKLAMRQSTCYCTRKYHM